MSVSTRREPKKKLKLLKYSSRLTILLIMQYMIWRLQSMVRF